MRLLFGFVGGEGHLNPLVPIARAALTAGHCVAVAAPPHLCDRVVAAGLTPIATGPTLRAPTSIRPLVPLDRAREDALLRDGFADRMARVRLTAVRQKAAFWRPDVIVCDEADYGTMLAAESLRIPYATVMVMLAGTYVRPELIADRLNAVRADYGLPPDPDLTMLQRNLVLVPGPSSYRDPSRPLPPTAVAIRPDDAEPTAEELLPTLDDRPTVYVTLGTIFNLESGDLFPRILAALTALDLNAVVTVGSGIDPAVLGAQPPTVHIVRWLSQRLILPHCAAAITHGGSGSTMGILAHGLPMVHLPMGADQPHNADRCTALGVARALDPLHAEPKDIAEALLTVLTEPRYRRAAMALQDDIAALPPASYAVTLLEKLA